MARRAGIYPCFAPSIEMRAPMVAARDVGRLAARCLLEPRAEIVDVSGPAYSAEDVGNILGAVLGRSLTVRVVPLEQQVPALMGAGLPQRFAEAVVELGCVRVDPQGDRAEEGTTSLGETLAAAIGRSFETLRREVSELQSAADGLAAIGAAIDARLSQGRPAPHVDEVLEASGVSVEGSQNELAALLGEIRTLSRSNDRLLYGGAGGWRTPDEQLLRAAGDVSIAFPYALRDRIAPRLVGLGERLASPDAAFLDIGVGVARMAIEMARVFPALRVVGIDPFAAPLALARENVAAAGLEDRVELREQAGEDLPDSRAFDLVRIAGAFVPRVAIGSVLARAHEAVRPGGWVLFAAIRPPEAPLAGALARMRAAELGGSFTPLEEIEAAFGAAGFPAVTALPAPPDSPFAMLAARRTEP